MTKSSTCSRYLNVSRIYFLVDLISSRASLEITILYFVGFSIGIKLYQSPPKLRQLYKYPLFSNSLLLWIVSHITLLWLLFQNNWFERLLFYYLCCRRHSITSFRFFLKLLYAKNFLIHNLHSEFLFITFIILYGIIIKKSIFFIMSQNPLLILYLFFISLHDTTLRICRVHNILNYFTIKYISYF